MKPPPFTAEQATKTLPLVGRIARDIVRLYAKWRERVAELELAAAASRADDPDPRLPELERDTQALAAEIEACIREIQALGAEYKTPLDAGLVDFPADLEGRPVYLCWRLGETAVEHWHEIDGGFAGRQPLVAQPIA